MKKFVLVCIVMTTMAAFIGGCTTLSEGTSATSKDVAPLMKQGGTVETTVLEGKQPFQINFIPATPEPESK